MEQFDPTTIRGIVFDLDGTLYASHTFASSIQEVSTIYIAGIKNIDIEQARHLMKETRERVETERDATQTISAVCNELGGNIRDLHAAFEASLRPESYLVRDERVISLLEILGGRFALYLYTNNNRTLTSRIISYLGIEGLFRRIYTIDDTWRAKPDEEVLDKVLSEAGLIPGEALFVGDRYDVDLRLPEQRGCPVYLSQSIEQLLRLEDLIRSP